MTDNDFIESCSHIDIATKDEFAKIKECLEEYSNGNDNQIKLFIYSPRNPSYGYIDGREQELKAFANKYKGEPIIRAYLCECTKNAQDLSEAFAKTNDAVIHPAHYAFAHEPIDVIADWGLNFNLGNTVKYISRAGRKDPNKTLEDLKKAKFYLDYEIEHFGEDK